MVETVKVIRAKHPNKVVVVNKDDVLPDDKLCDDEGKLVRKQKVTTNGPSNRGRK